MVEYNNSLYVSICTGTEDNMPNNNTMQSFAPVSYTHLYALTQKTAKPAVSFGGKYRIVDFPLSNCVNSNIDTVGIATQYQPQKLNEYTLSAALLPLSD